MSEAQVQRGAASVRRLLGEMAAYRGELLLALGSTVLGAATQAAAPWLVSQAIDNNILNGNTPGLARTLAGLLAVYAVGTLASRAQIFQVGSVGQRLLASLRGRLFEHLGRLPLAFFDRRPLGDLMSRITNDVDTLNQLLSQGLTQLLGSLFGLIGLVLAMLLLNVPLAIVSFTVIPLSFLATSVFSRLARGAFRTTRETTGDVTAELQEEITGIREAQAFNRTETNIARFRERNRANRDAHVAAVAVTAAFAPTIDVLSTLAIAVVIGFGGYLLLTGQLSVGVVAAFLIYVQQFFRPIRLISQVYTPLQAALGGAERIYAILDEPEEAPDPARALVLDGVDGRVTFDGVSFGYDPTLPVLHDVSFDVAAGQTVALVGRTGAGKTTIANLVPRFYDVSRGTVRVDGHDVRSVTRTSLRGQMAMVLQEPFLFGGTVADNIAYGLPGACLPKFKPPAVATRTSTRASSGTRRTGSPPPDDHGSTSPLGRITVIRWRLLTCPGGNDDKRPVAYRRRGQHQWEKARCLEKVIFDAAHSFVLRQWALLLRNSESWVPHARSLIRAHRMRRATSRKPQLQPCPTMLRSRDQPSVRL